MRKSKIVIKITRLYNLFKRCENPAVAATGWRRSSARRAAGWCRSPLRRSTCAPLHGCARGRRGVRICVLVRPCGFALFDDEMLVGEGRDLRQDASRTAPAGRGASAFSLWPTASAARPPMPMSISSKTSVRGVGFLPGLGRVLFDGDLQRQHHAAHLAARGDLSQRLQRLAGVGGDAVFHLVPAGCGPVRIPARRCAHRPRSGPSWPAS